MEIVKFVSFVVRLGLLLAFCGQLKFSTLQLMGMAGEKTQKGMISYSKYNRLYTKPSRFTIFKICGAHWIFFGTDTLCENFFKI